MTLPKFKVGVRTEVADGAEILSGKVQQEDSPRWHDPLCPAQHAVVLPVKPALNRPTFISRLGQFMIRPNRHFPRFLGTDCSKDRKKSIAGRKGLHATFCALLRAWAAPTWVAILKIRSRD